MALNTNRLGRSKQLARGGGGNFLKLKNGKNTLRVFSFPHEADQSDFDRGLYKKSDGIKLGEEFDEVERVCYVHYTEDGVENCPRVGCDTCEKSDDYLASKDKADLKLGKDLKASKRFNVNVVDMDDVEKGMQICALPGSVFNAILEYLMDNEYGADVLGCNGRDFIIARDTNQTPDKMYALKLRDKERCQELDEELQNSVADLFKMKSLDPGWSPEAKEDPAPTAGKASGKGGKPAPSPVDDEDDKPTGKPAKAGSKEDKADDKKKAMELKNEFDDKDDKPTNTNDKGRKTKREIPDWIEKGAACEFTNKKGQPEVGTISEIHVDKEEVEVETDSSFWDLDYDDVRPVKKSKERNRK